MTEDIEPQSSPGTSGDLKPTYRRNTMTERLVEREEIRLETRTADGTVRCSEGERRERVKERIVTQDLRPEEDDVQTTVRMRKDDDASTQEQTEQDPLWSPGEQDLESSDEEAVQELALEERELNDDRPGTWSYEPCNTPWDRPGLQVV